MVIVNKHLICGDIDSCPVYKRYKADHVVGGKTTPINVIRKLDGYSCIAMDHFTTAVMNYDAKQLEQVGIKDDNITSSLTCSTLRTLNLLNRLEGKIK